MPDAPAPLLMLPGLMCDSRMFAPQLAAFAGALAVDGYGDADSLDAMAQVALTNAPARFSLLGHSMGGRVALEVWRLAPERVERLALLDTGTHPVRAGEAKGRYALRDLGRADGIAALVDAWLPPMVHPDRRDDHALLQPMRDMVMAGGVDRYERQISALLNRPDPTPDLRLIACPTLVATGAQDNWSTPAQHQEIAAAIPGSILRIFEHCGHMAPLEAPDHVNAAIAEWLNLPIDEKERI